ncbi:uncharacterized protein LOC126577489 [Anopheles aquasalis]|uniref:uncharacterized protein LOC126577489 n=1 Tax=Anopheles aquasalis TaxID=42839 RepID=UPI00215B4209|nr:uncharacterized protein LOC126577489 [Anopheles aquasalis]
MASFRAIILSLCLLSQFYGGFVQGQYGPMTERNAPTRGQNGVYYGNPENAAHREVEKHIRISCRENAINYDCLFKDVHIEESEAVSPDRFVDHGRSYTTDVKSLAFVSSTIRRLPKELLATYPYTALLNLREVQLRAIDRDAFMYGGQLQQLYVGFNSLPFLDRGVFDSLSSLGAIDLNRNLLSYLPMDLFWRNPSLYSVSISNNALTRIEDRTFIYNAILESVNVSSNSIEYFDLGQLTAAYEIDVSYNKLTQVRIPSSLSRLFASNNLINSIVSNGQNRELKELYLSNNKLTTISWAALYPGLEELDLSHNEIEEIKREHLVAANLTKLLLNNNRLFSFDLNPVPKHLRVLDLSHNQLSYVEKSTKLFDRLHQLYLHNNAIVALKLSPNNTLQNVSLSNNDWDCANLRTQLGMINPNSVQDLDVPPCKHGYIMESSLCCKETAMPYHDRLLEQIHTNNVFTRGHRIQCEGEPHAIVDIDELNKGLQTVSSESPEALRGELRELKSTVASLSAEKTSGQQELYTVKQLLSNKLPRYGGIHEGFDTARMLADKLISRLDDRKRLRESKSAEGREEAKAKETERDELKSFIDSLETILKNKKAVNLKMKKDTAETTQEIKKLQAKLNANARSSRINI